MRDQSEDPNVRSPRKRQYFVWVCVSSLVSMSMTYLYLSNGNELAVLPVVLSSCLGTAIAFGVFDGISKASNSLMCVGFHLMAMFPATIIVPLLDFIAPVTGMGGSSSQIFDNMVWSAAMGSIVSVPLFVTGLLLTYFGTFLQKKYHHS